MDKKALLLVSGGYDSYVIAALCDSLCYQNHALFFAYGQKAYTKERGAVSRLCDLFIGSGFRQSDFLTEIAIDAPWLMNGFNKGDNYFPWRNFIFLSYALSYAEANKYDIVVTGTNSAGEYPDSTDSFMKNIEGVYQAAGIQLWNPLHAMYKGDVYSLGEKLGVQFEDTWSCDFSNTIPCGKCLSCQDIKAGLEAGYLKNKISFLDTPVV